MILHLTKYAELLIILIYNFSLWLRRMGFLLFTPWNRKSEMWVEGRKGVLDILRNKYEGGPRKLIWMHCPSSDQYEQGSPLLEKLKYDYPNYEIVVTVFSSEGYQWIKQYNDHDDIYFLPDDSPENASEFCDAIKPELVIWIACDYFFFYLDELSKRKIPCLLVSASFTSGRSAFSWHGILRHKMLELFEHIFVQDNESLKRIPAIGAARHVSVAGDTRFDRVVAIANTANEDGIIKKFCGDARVIVAGNTWEEDEEELDHYANTHREIKFIIIPHDADDERLGEIRQLFKYVVFLSELEQQQQLHVTTPSSNTEHPNVLLVDTPGNHANLYGYATITYVGGGFVDRGVHNMLEAAVFGKPVLCGPVIDDDEEAMDLADIGAAIIIDSALEAEAAFDRLLTSSEEYETRGKAAKDYVYSGTGATATIMQYIQENRLLTS